MLFFVSFSQGDEWREVQKISDVSVELDFVAALCDKCNVGQLSPIHLLDVVLDQPQNRRPA